MKGAVLLTGATGFVGMEILARYLERTDRPVYRAGARPRRGRGDQRGCATRPRASSATRTPSRTGWSALPRRHRATRASGSTRPTRERVAEQVTDIVHSAASVSFTLPLDRSREINVEGTRRMLELAELCQRRGGPRALLLHLDRVRGRDPQGRVRRGPARRRAALPQPLRAVEVRGRAARACARRAAPDPDLPAQHRRRRAHHRLDPGLQRPLLAAEGVRARVAARRCRRAARRPSTWCPSTTSRMRCSSSRGDPVNGTSTYHLVAGPRATSVGRLIELSARRRRASASPS